MLIALLLVACDGSSDTGEAEAETPVVSFVSPTDGDTVTAGDVPVSIAVEHFLLVDLAKHNEGEPEGYISFTYTQGATSETMESSETAFTAPLEAGAATLTADLYFEDGDQIGEEFADFEPVTIAVTVE
jgi:hypothetical protein